jgi:hypothetical protein
VHGMKILVEWAQPHLVQVQLLFGPQSNNRWDLI